MLQMMMMFQYSHTDVLDGSMFQYLHNDLVFVDNDDNPISKDHNDSVVVLVMSDLNIFYFFVLVLLEKTTT